MGVYQNIHRVPSWQRRKTNGSNFFNYIIEEDEVGFDFCSRLFDIGFLTDKGSCDAVAAEFLAKVQGKETFLFGTPGYGGETSYFEKILKNVSHKLEGRNTIISTYMCQGKMPMTVRNRYKKCLQPPFMRRI